MIKVAAALLLLLGSGLIFKALVEMDAPALRQRPLKRGPFASGRSNRAEEPALRRAA
jgi:hypothetical protein